MDRMLTRIRLAQVVRPFLMLAPRGYGRLYKAILGDDAGTWRGDPILKQKLRRRIRIFWDRHIKANVVVDLGDWCCRAHYFKGVYHDRIVPKLLEMHLREGGTFIDVGANRGIHTLHACRQLEGRGYVYAFEPNPYTFKVLDAHIIINNVDNCLTFNMALGSEPGKLELHSFMDDHSGTCSLLKHSDVKASFQVPVERLDDVLRRTNLSGNLVVKIDTEGFEYEVLKGMEATLAIDGVVVVCEMTDRWLRMAGASAKALFDFMESMGFRAYGLSIRYHRLFFERLELLPMTAPPDELQYDVAFARPGVLPN